MQRDRAIEETRRLIAEGERLESAPSMGGLRLWLQLSDDLLSSLWGTMDRYHLSWLMVGKPKDAVRGRPMTPDEEESYVRDVASQKGAALRMSLRALEEQEMPFVGETPGRGAGSEPRPAGDGSMEAGDGGVRAARELGEAHRRDGHHRTSR